MLMSDQVQTIIEAVRRLSVEQRHELVAALAAEERSQAVLPSREDIVNSIRGKYKYVPTSVEAFLKQKKDEIARELC